MSINLHAVANEPLPGTTLYRRFLVDGGKPGREIHPLVKGDTVVNAMRWADFHKYAEFETDAGFRYKKIDGDWWQVIRITGSDIC